MSFFGGGRGGPYRPRGNNQSNMRFGLLPLVRPTFNNNRGNFRGGGRGQRSHQGGLGTRRNQQFRFQNNMPPRNNASPRQVVPRQQVTPRPGQIVRLGPSKPVPPKTDAKVETKVETEVDKQKDVAKLESKQEVETDNNQEKNEKEKPKAEEKGKVVTDKVTTAPVQEIKTEKRLVTLDRHNCELHMVTDKSLLVAENMRGDGFQYMWAGARANFGVKTGKVCYEVHLTESLNVKCEGEANPYVCRFGWSVDNSDYQLGEDKLSWGYGGTAKSSYNSKFLDYGKKYGVGDTITCYVDLDANPKAIFYSLNGQYLGVAFRFTNELDKKPLFPHISLKNMKVKLNFGGEAPKFPLTNGFKMMQEMPQEELYPPSPSPQTQEEAEIIMMVGLPASGKSFWCEKYAKENMDKKYYILGTNTIIDRMKVTGLSRKRNYHGRWEELIKRASSILNKLFHVATNLPRNYILDQTNVYPSARKRKMGSFQKYKRIAVVVVNKPDVLADRTAKQQKVEGKEIPRAAIMEMKANFTLPEVGPSFDEVRYIEEQLPLAQKLVDEYKAQGESFKKNLTVLGKRQKFEHKDSPQKQNSTPYKQVLPQSSKGQQKVEPDMKNSKFISPKPKSQEPSNINNQGKPEQKIYPINRGINPASTEKKNLTIENLSKNKEPVRKVETPSGKDSRKTFTSTANNQKRVDSRNDSSNRRESYEQNRKHDDRGETRIHRDDFDSKRSIDSNDRRNNFNSKEIIDRRENIGRQESFDRRESFDRQDNFEWRDNFDRRETYERRYNLDRREGFDRRAESFNREGNLFHQDPLRRHESQRTSQSRNELASHEPGPLRDFSPKRSHPQRYDERDKRHFPDERYDRDDRARYDESLQRQRYDDVSRRSDFPQRDLTPRRPNQERDDNFAMQPFPGRDRENQERTPQRSLNPHANISRDELRLRKEEDIKLIDIKPKEFPSRDIYPQRNIPYESDVSRERISHEESRYRNNPAARYASGVDHSERRGYFTDRVPLRDDKSFREREPLNPTQFPEKRPQDDRLYESPRSARDHPPDQREPPNYRSRYGLPPDEGRSSDYPHRNRSYEEKSIEHSSMRYPERKPIVPGERIIKDNPMEKSPADQRRLYPTFDNVRSERGFQERPAVNFHPDDNRTNKDRFGQYDDRPPLRNPHSENNVPRDRAYFDNKKELPSLMGSSFERKRGLDMPLETRPGGYPDEANLHERNRQENIGFPQRGKNIQRHPVEFAGNREDQAIQGSRHNQPPYRDNMEQKPGFPSNPSNDYPKGRGQPSYSSYDRQERRSFDPKSNDRQDFRNLQSNLPQDFQDGRNNRNQGYGRFDGREPQSSYGRENREHQDPQRYGQHNDRELQSNQSYRQDRRDPQPRPSYGHQEMRDARPMQSQDSYANERGSHQHQPYSSSQEKPPYSALSSYHSKGYSYISSSNQANDRMSSGSHQPQMTTSTANYSQSSFNTTRHSQQQYTQSSEGVSQGDKATPYRDSKENQAAQYEEKGRYQGSYEKSNYQKYPEQAPPPPKNPAQSNQRDIDANDPSYEKQQEDYQRAYSQWYANYAQAFAELTQQNQN